MPRHDPIQSQIWKDQMRLDRKGAKSDGPRHDPVPLQAKRPRPPHPRGSKGRETGRGRASGGSPGRTSPGGAHGPSTRKATPPVDQ